MTPQQIAHIRQSFSLVAPVAPQAAAMFYENLFAADTTLRPLFRGNMVQQGNLLMRMIQGAVGMLDNPELLLPTLHSLGARHTAYGVKEQHYGTVGRALLRTLSDALGDAFTPDVADAWATMYDLVSRTMQEGAEEAKVADARSAALVV